MKPIYAILALILIISSCKKDDPADTTFTLTNNSTFYESSFEYLDGSLYEVVIFYYKGEDVIGQENIVKVQYGGGKSSVIKVADGCEKLKVSFKMLPPESPYYELSSNSRYYTVSYFTIKPNQNNEIVIDDKTMLSGSLKSNNTNHKISNVQSNISKIEIETLR